MRNLDPEHYVSSEIHRADVERIFSRTWQLLGPASRLAERGDYFATEIAGQKVFAIRTSSGLRAFRNVCRHRGARLLEEGVGRCLTIRCPYHQWVWGDDGSLLNTPWWGDDPEFTKEDWRLFEIDLRVWRGLLFVAIAPDAPLEDQFGDLVGEIAEEPLETYEWVREERLVFEANWKIYTDNFVEGYHIPGIHPAFHQAIEFEAFETTALDGMVRMTAPPRDGLFYRGKWLWMWPNWTPLALRWGDEHVPHQPDRSSPNGTDLQLLLRRPLKGRRGGARENHRGQPPGRARRLRSVRRDPTELRERRVSGGAALAETREGRGLFPAALARDAGGGVTAGASVSMFRTIRSLGALARAGAAATRLRAGVGSVGRMGLGRALWEMNSREGRATDPRPRVRPSP